MSNGNSNIGWLFSKDYYSGLHNGMSDDVKKKDRMVHVEVADCQHPQDEDEKKVIEQFFKKKNDNIIECSVNIDNGLNLNGSSFVLETIYPGLIIGTGIIHETGQLGECKLGLQFDHTTGLPYIPGSSVKGLLRSMFPYSIPENKKGNWKSYRDQRTTYIKETVRNINPSLVLSNDDVKDLEFQIFEGVKDNNAQSMCVRCVFYDAMISGYNNEKGILGLDYITPHLNPLKNPNPIQFMKVLPEVQFRFQFRIPDKIVLKSGEVSKDNILALFKTILMEIGIGAKTNVGYGQLVEVTPNEKKTPPKQRIRPTKDVQAKLLKLNGEWQITINEYCYTKAYSIDRVSEKTLGKVRPNIPIPIIATVQIDNNKISKILKITKK